MRCPDCGKFVSYDEDQEPEEEGETTLTDDQINGTYTRTLVCAECSTELKQASIEIDQQIDLVDEEGNAIPVECEASDGGHDWSLELDAEATSRTETGRWEEATKASTRKKPARVRRGTRKDGEPNEIETKTIKPGDVVWNQWPSFKFRTYYGVALSGTATCQNCKKVVVIEAVENDEMASSFDELV